ncbi:uncharacterized protein LOC112573933 [Pomacea canaliculata]|uniref:uncharacterized protein LOC112573933 n=1 Tax=Pomacea canaliculata TaxID=400727 RepID=UPI000D733C64|nr:uncharacterized protein LOC112573933 [Pomacea canaliculata]
MKRPFANITVMQKMAAREDPVYLLSDTKKEGYVRVRVEIQGLKAKKLTLIEKFTGGKRTEAKNGTVLCHFQDRGFRLEVQGDGKKLTDETFERLHLPYDIDTETSYWETEDNFVNIFLKKADDKDDWSPFIESGKLEAE